MENYSEFFYIDIDSPSGLRWKVDRYSGKNNSRIIVKKGDIAGTKNFINKIKPKCWKVKLSGKQIKVHRIVWFLHHGKISDDLIINHIDNNPFNNRLDNLELVTMACNSQRQSKHAKIPKISDRNKSGINGIFKFRQENREYVRAVISIPKSSSIVKSIRVHSKEDEINAFNTLSEWRNDKIKELVSDGILGYVDWSKL